MGLSMQTQIFLKYDYVDMLLRGMMGLPESFHTRHFNFSLFQGPFIFCEFYSEPVGHKALYFCIVSIGIRIFTKNQIRFETLLELRTN